MTAEEEATTTTFEMAVNPVITAILESTNETSIEEAEFPFCQYNLDAFHTA